MCSGVVFVCSLSIACSITPRRRNGRVEDGVDHCFSMFVTRGDHIGTDEVITTSVYPAFDGQRLCSVAIYSSPSTTPPLFTHEYQVTRLGEFKLNVHPGTTSIKLRFSFNSKEITCVATDSYTNVSKRCAFTYAPPVHDDARHRRDISAAVVLLPSQLLHAIPLLPWLPPPTGAAASSSSTATTAASATANLIASTSNNTIGRSSSTSSIYASPYTCAVRKPVAVVATTATATTTSTIRSPAAAAASQERFSPPPPAAAAGYTPVGTPITTTSAAGAGTATAVRMRVAPR
jgi:hypothetical protein